MLSNQFICATEKYGTYLEPVPAPYIRKSFELKKRPETAKITICGLGFYELFINGQRITKGHLAPYISAPDDIIYYDSYDISNLLKEGKNAIGILLGNGMLNCVGGAVWDFDKASWRSAPKVALHFESNDSNGNHTEFFADTTFKTHPSPILFDDLRCGEFYDANLEIPDWNMPDFDDSDWQNALVAEAPKGEAKLCTAEPIVVLDTLKPVSINSGKKAIFNPNLHPQVGIQIALPKEECEGYLYDFGQNLAGTVTLKINGQKGQKISILFGELLNDDGDINHFTMCFQPQKYEHRIEYTLKGDGEEVYSPSFTYFGFRYCLVSGLTEEQAIPDLLTFNVMSSDIKKNGDFSCSNEIINSLQKATYNADISNFFYFPTDCPHREKNGWTGDAALSAEQMLFNLRPEKSYHVWLDNIRKAQHPNGSLPGIIPTGGWGFEWGNGPAWDAVLFNLPYYTWVQRGDTAIIEENVDAMVKYLNYVASRRDEDGLLHIGLGDWLPINYKNPITPLEVTDTLVTMNNCLLASRMFDAVNCKKEKAVADALFFELREAARKHLLSADGTVRGRTQTAQCMAIQYGLLDDDERQAAFDVLLDIIHEADDHLDTGCLGARIIFHTLSQFGYTELAYKMIARTDYPSYGYWIKEKDCTSLFEDFYENVSSPGSKNHHFFGDISSWFFKYLAGVKINPNHTDYREIEISPEFIDGLDFVNGYQYHPFGKIVCDWKKENNHVILNLTIPDGCYGKIKAPGGYVLFGEDTIKAGMYKYIFEKC